MENHSLDVPYADTFRLMEFWDIFTSSPSQHKCILRVTMNVKFLKSTLFRGKITTKAKEGFAENI